MLASEYMARIKQLEEKFEAEWVDTSNLSPKAKAKKKQKAYEAALAELIKAADAEGVTRDPAASAEELAELAKEFPEGIPAWMQTRGMTAEEIRSSMALRRQAFSQTRK